MVTLEDVQAARSEIAGKLHRTPLVRSTVLGEQIGEPLYFKLENWQKTGSFKPRGVLAKVAQLSQAERERGLIAFSAGNHAQALAWAAASVGVPSTIVMPADAPSSKVAATRGYGGNVVLEPVRARMAERCQELAAEHGYVLVAPFDDPAVVAGQGTVGLEILEDLPDVGTVVVPIGGGGLIAGVALAIKNLRPRTRVIGVEPSGANSMWRSRREGHAVHLDRLQTIADGLTAPFAGELTYAMVEQYVDDLVLVDDADIRRATFLILERCKILAEPAGATALAALLTGAATPKPGEPVVALISGGNTDVATLGQLLAGE